MAAGVIRHSLPSVLLIVGAFLFSVIGDYFLSNKRKDENNYLYGVSFFFLAHAAYLIFNMMNGRMHVHILFGITGIFMLYYIIRLYPTVTDTVMAAALLLYSLISCVSISAAAGIRFPVLPKVLMIFGISMILLSDTVIGETDFFHNRRFSRWILPTYFIAHIAITYSVLLWIW